MLKLNFKLLKGVILLLLLFSFKNVYAADNYIINNYHVKATINENNTYDIEEKISVEFTKPSHGIFRKIKSTAELLRENGKTDSKKFRITKISANDKTKVTKENNYYVIRIGKKDKYVYQKDYVIKYTINAGKDLLKNIDELYLNLLGDEWNNVINNFSFEVIMPKQYDTSKVGFSIGYKGSSGYDKNILKYTTKDNKIIGSINKPLLHDNVTIRIELPNNYFIKNDFLNLFIVPSLLVFLGIILMGFNNWKKYGKDGKILEVVEFYPPENKNPLEIAYCNNNKIEIKYISSLFIHLAAKGYLKIEENGKNDFIITLIKDDYYKLSQTEQNFIRYLFKNKKTVKTNNLPESFINHIESIIEGVIEKEKKLMFEDYPRKYYLMALLIVFTILFTFTQPILYYKMFENIYLLIGGVFLVFINIYTEKYNKNSTLINAISIILTIALVIYLRFFIVKIFNNISDLSIMFEENLFKYNFIAMIITILILIFVAAFLPKLNEYGLKIKGQVRGFKKFLKYAEKDKIEKLVNDDPSYFYNILPYAYVLGVTSAWIKKFEKMNITKPNWYSGNFDLYMMNSISNRIGHSVSTSYTQHIAATNSNFSGGGGFSGGGFSGGGFGGGGGGSW